MKVAFKSATGTGTTEAAVLFAPVAKATPVLSAYHVTSDKASSLVAVWTGSATVQTTVDAVSGTGQAVLNVTATTGFTTSRVMIVSAATGVPYMRTVTSIQAGVSLTMTTNLPVQFEVGDKVYLLEQIGSLPLAAATVTNYGGEPGILGGNYAKGLAVVADGTSAVTIHTASVYFDDGK